MILKFIFENIELFIGLATTFLGYWFGAKTRKNQEKSGELQNLITLRQVEKQLIKDMKDSIKEYQEVIINLNAIIDKKDKIITRLKNIVDKQQKELNKYKN